MGDINDIDTDVSLIESDQESWSSALYLFDTHEGGIGYAEKIYESIDDACRLCQTIIRDCSCRSGCPACVPPLPPGIADEDLEQFLIESDAAVQSTASLLLVVLEGTIQVPQVTVHKRAAGPTLTPVPDNEDLKKLNRRLHRASKILRQKREKQH